jgi:hypothetical protein
MPKEHFRKLDISAGKSQLNLAGKSMLTIGLWRRSRWGKFGAGIFAYIFMLRMLIHIYHILSPNRNNNINFKG